MTTVTVLKPGLLVSLKTSLRGGVTYARRDIEADHTTEEGARRAAWETVREIPDPEEFERATQARSKARVAVSRACCASSFGLLCPQARKAELQAGIEEARAIAREHNLGASRSYVDVFVIVGRVAQDDAEAARAISSELRELMQAMKDGIAAADPEAIREAATRARNLGAMLTPDVAGKVSEAITEARKAARELTARVGKAGEQAAAVVAELQVSKIEAARFAFLDMDEGAAPEAEPAPARALDLAPEAEPATISAAPAVQRALEL